MKFLSSYQAGNILIHSVHDSDSGRVGLLLCPVTLDSQRIQRRGGLAGLPYIDAMPGAGNPPAQVCDPSVQVKIAGDPYPGAFSQGHTMRNSPSVDRFRFEKQDLRESGTQTVLFTSWSSAEGYRLEHELSWKKGAEALQSRSRFINGSGKAVTLEMLSSFSMGGITPFHEADAPGRLQVHRFRSVWSAEGRLETRSLEELHLERSWERGRNVQRTLRAGRFHAGAALVPFRGGGGHGRRRYLGRPIGLGGVLANGIFRQHDDVCLSGGLADREFGHWMKTLQPGETLLTPPAYLTSVQGGLDEACDALTSLQEQAVEDQPQVEQDLPVVFNEWCTTWGDPQHEKVVAIADRLMGSGVRYLVIDAGWYKSGNSDWSSGHGDWVPSETLFPEGLEAVAGEIRKRGLIPGLWFEMETVGSQSVAFSLVDHLLQRDGVPVTVRERRFWNLNDPWAVNYLTEKVIDVLERGNFGYLKVDYNETIGLGSEDPDGLGEGMRKQVEGIYRFFEKIRQRLPELVIENCSSGGHRLEPSMMARTAMSSFSDAHELVEIPLIAANLHSLMLPRQSQIWAVLHPYDSDRRLMYSLTATFLGRMCLSGDVSGLNESQWERVIAAIGSYHLAAPIIKHGRSRRFGALGESWRHPSGWQAVRRISDCGTKILVVVHSFAKAPGEIGVPLPPGKWSVVAQMGSGEHCLQAGEDNLSIAIHGDFAGSVWILKKGNEIYAY